MPAHNAVYGLPQILSDGTTVEPAMLSDAPNSPGRLLLYKTQGPRIAWAGHSTPIRDPGFRAATQTRPAPEVNALRDPSRAAVLIHDAPASALSIDRCPTAIYDHVVAGGQERCENSQPLVRRRRELYQCLESRGTSRRSGPLREPVPSGAQ